MNQEELQKEFIKLCYPQTIEGCQNLIDIYCNFLLEAILENHKPYAKVKEGEASLIFQMMMTKALHLKSVLDGITFTSKNGKRLPNIIDPSIVAVLIRNIYETVGLFALIYRFHNLSEQQEVVYKLWVISGLKYRQKFESNIREKENREKFEAEQAQIKQLESEIYSIKAFQMLDAKGQTVIVEAIKKKQYLIYFNGNTASSITLTDLWKLTGGKREVFENIYNYFSLYAHPSNVSVFQFSDYFTNDSYLGLIAFNIQYAFMLLSIFIADYIIYQPAVLRSFNNLSILDQTLINFYNKMARSEEYSINDSSKYLG